MDCVVLHFYMMLLYMYIAVHILISICILSIKNFFEVRRKKICDVLVHEPLSLGDESLLAERPYVECLGVGFLFSYVKDPYP